MKTFCPNCERETECTHAAELYECKECGEDFAKYIVSRTEHSNSDVSMTQSVLTDVKTQPAIENGFEFTEALRVLAKTRPADVSAIGVSVLIDHIEKLEAENKSIKHILSLWKKTEAMKEIESLLIDLAQVSTCAYDSEVGRMKAEALAKKLEAALKAVRGIAGNKFNPEADKAVIIGIVNDALKDGE